MLRKVYLYLLLVVVRLYYATRTSYIHPDEAFQGPEVIIGEILGWPVYKTWEFTSSHPIRSTFPLWIVYGPSLTLLKWISEGLHHEVSPMAVFYVLRTLMFLLSFVLQDWALHELIPARRERTLALILVSSSYVTWTYQAHTFSNSIETIIVLWCMVVMQRLRDTADRTGVRLCAALAFLGVLGVFTRITFPAFLVIPAADIIPHLLSNPLRIPVLVIVGTITALVAVAMDTEYYTGSPLKLRHLFDSAVFTPWNNLAYNIDTANLAEHGLHPFWQHFVASLPQLLGPAYPLIFFSSRKGVLFWSGIIGTAILSCFRHQEPRFLLPAVPLLMSSIRIPSKSFTRIWVASWIVFNMLAATLFGVYHQGGVIPVQTWIEQQPNISQVFWWKTYSPPRWLLDGKNVRVTTIDLMGMPGEDMLERVGALAPCRGGSIMSLLVAPSSAVFLDAHTQDANADINFARLFHHNQHVGLDDLDFGDDGLWPTLNRVIGRRGLDVWQISRTC